MSKFLQSTLASVVGGLLALGLVALALLTYFFEEQVSEIPERCVLILDDTLVTSEAGSHPSLAAWISAEGKPSLALRKVLQGIRHAVTDDRIRAILLRNSGQYHGLTALKEVQEALIDFRDNGKAIYAYAPGYDQNSYYLASVAKPVVMPPLGVFELNGFSAEIEFYAEAMEKIGVEVQVTRVGKYKSAVEPYLLRTASSENKQQIQELLESLQATYLEDLSHARALGVDSLRAIVAKDGVMSAVQAQEYGLVDQVAYYDSVLDALKELVGPNADDSSFAQVGFYRYWEDVAQEELKSKEMVTYPATVINVVYAEGEIVDGYAEEGIGGDSLAEQLRSIRLDYSVDGVVLRVNSPGGSASASEVILREMQLLRESGKTVVVSMGPVAASGGYWIACQADAIFAEANTITGSIGVFGMFPNIETLLQKIGVHVDVVKTGPHADWMSLYHHKSASELALVQGYIDTTYQGFLDRVAAGRHLELDVVQDIAQGRVWSGQKALELGLVDGLGGLQAAILSCAEKIGVDEWHVDYLEPEMDGLDAILATAMAPEDVPVVGVALPRELQELGSRWAAWRNYAQHPGVYARLAFHLNIH